MGTFIYTNFTGFVPVLEKWKKEFNLNSKGFVNVLNVILENTLGSQVKKIELKESGRSRSSFEDDNFTEFDNCKIHLQRLEESIVREVITKMCTNVDINGIYMSLRKEDVDLDLLSSLAQKPLHVMNKIKSFAFGTIVNAMTFIPHFDSQIVDKRCKISNGETIAQFEHDINSLSVYFRVDSVGGIFKSVRYKMFIRYETIKAIIFCPNGETMTMYVVLKCPPFMFQSLEDNINFKNRSHIVNKCDDISPSDEWIRTANFGTTNGEVYGKCNVLKLDVPLIKNPDKLVPHIHYECPWSLLKCLPSFRDIPIYFTYIKESPELAVPKNINVLLTLDAIKESKKFDILYALECIQSHSWQLVDELDFDKTKTKFRKLMNSFAAEDPDALEDSLYLLYDSIQMSHFINIFNCFQKFFELRRKMDRSIYKLPKNNIMFRRVAITPTRLLVLPKLPYKQSLFANEPPEGSEVESTLYRAEYAIRAELKDDDMNKLTWSLNRLVNWELENLLEKEERDGRLRPKDRDRMVQLKNVDDLGDTLLNKFMSNLVNDRFVTDGIVTGLQICGRTYNVYGSSPSQMKDCGMVLYTKDCYGYTAEDIRLSLGDIYEQKNIGKFITRVGLSVSEVEEFIDVSNVDIDDDLADIIGGTDNKYTFSDGCGQMSKSLADKIFEKLREKNIMDNIETTPSAFQIRIGGCKGMLVINPDIKGDQIKIRRSMRKFRSPNMSLLGILKVSNIRPVHLNRPFVMLLDQLGTSRQYLMQLLTNHLSNFSNAFVNDDIAKDILYNHSTLPRYVNMALLVRNGIRLLDEPFFRLCLESVAINNVRQMKEKARIKIDRDLGRSMFGVIDETFTLESGEIFVRYTDANDNTKKTVLTGKVLVTKFPCMHPGDVQVFNAVDVPKLYHIVDCIVFPAKGNRPHSDEMAGSDLDGDEYAVIWDKNLYPKQIMNPMNIPSEEAPTVDDRVTDLDILEFFKKYVKEYSVGRIADAHLAWSDSSENGIFDPKCLKLAEKHAISLDFPKTGITKKLAKQEIVKLFPDYMERHKTRGFYNSKRALGNIYRQIKLVERGLLSDVPLDFARFQNKKLIYNQSEFLKYKKAAEDSYYKYARFVEELQYRYKISSEASIIFGNTDESDDYLVSSQQSKQLGYKIRDLVRDMINNLKNDFEFEFRNRTDADVYKDKMTKASAYYYFTSECSDRVKYFGLPWLFSEYLADVAAKSSEEIKSSKRNYSDDLYGFVAHNISFKFKEDENTVVDDRVTNARKFLKMWLLTHKHLHISKQLLETQVMKALGEEVELETNFGEVPSSGQLVVNVFRKFAKEVLELDESLPSCEKNAKRSLALSAMITLQNIYTTRNMNFLVHHRPLPQNLSFQQYYLSFVENNRDSREKKRILKDFIAKNDKIFRDAIKELSGVNCVYGRWFERRNQHHYYLSAFGTQITLMSLNMVIAALHTNKDYDVNTLFLMK